MKENIHPKYQKALFVDSSTGHKYLIGTTLQTNEKETFQGKEYPVSRVSISASSHPFFTGAGKLLDTEGRVDRFTKRYQSAQQKIQDKKDEQALELQEKAVSKTKKKK